LQAELLNALYVNPEFLNSRVVEENVITSRHLEDSFYMKNHGILDNDCDEGKGNELQRKKGGEIHFQKWLKKVFRPSHQRIYGDGHLNPVLYFHLTKLSSGYIGGLISI